MAKRSAAMFPALWLSVASTLVGDEKAGKTLADKQPVAHKFIFIERRVALGTTGSDSSEPASVMLTFKVFFNELM